MGGRVNDGPQFVERDGVDRAAAEKPHADLGQRRRCCVGHSGRNRASGRSTMSSRVTRWLAASVAAVSVPISPAPTTTTCRPGRSRRLDERRETVRRSYSPRRAQARGRAASGTAGQSPRRASAPRARSDRRRSRASLSDAATPTRPRTTSPSMCLMPLAARPSASASSGSRPVRRARLESGGRSCGSPGPIIVTGIPCRASVDAQAYPATPFPTTMTGSTDISRSCMPPVEPATGSTATRLRRRWRGRSPSSCRRRT